jgi:hypothetical protein
MRNDRIDFYITCMYADMLDLYYRKRCYQRCNKQERIMVRRKAIENGLYE